MAEKKVSASRDKKNSKSPILESLNVLFYLSKIFGMVPYSYSDFVTKKQFKVSQLGNIFCVLSCIGFIILYHLLMSITMLVKDPENSIGTLTTVIGIFIIYMEPLMMAIDAVACIINQKRFITIFDRLRDIDDKLEKENVMLNYRVITKYSVILVFIFLIGELALGVFKLVVFKTEFFSFSSLLWLASSVPLFANGLAKTWFLVFILLVQQRLRAINDYLNETKKIFFERKIRHFNANGSNLKKDNLFIENIGYLEKEIFSTRNMKIKSDNAWNWVGNSIVTNKVNDINIFAPKSRAFVDVAPLDVRDKGEDSQFEFDWLLLKLSIFILAFSLSFIHVIMLAAGKKSMMMESFYLNDHDSLIGDKMDKKLINLCRAHDEICEIAKQVNQMFSFQMLITMAYGFMSITAQFYFFYCGLMDQVLIKSICFACVCYSSLVWLIELI